MWQKLFMSSWQMRNKEKIFSYLDFINDSLPPLIELRVNWPFLLSYNSV